MAAKVTVHVYRGIVAKNDTVNNARLLVLGLSSTQGLSCGVSA